MIEQCFGIRQGQLAKAYPGMTEEEKRRAMDWYTGWYNKDGGLAG